MALLRSLGKLWTAAPPSTVSRIKAQTVKTAAAAVGTVGGTVGTADEALTNLDVIVRREENLRLFLLNRPHALNALSTNMVNLMTPQLKAWDESDHAKVILLTSVEGCRSFCAGGDVKGSMMRARSQLPADLAIAMKFIESEYRLNHLIGTLSTPYISLMNGIAMGGGIGISVHAPFRIATENTLFAMPEASIGLFPDVGGSFFLPRLDGELGTYLGLTCHRLQGVEVFLAGIASHYMPAKRIPALLEALAGIETDELVEINRILEKFAEPLKQDTWRHWSLGGEVANAINRTFKYDTVEEIIEALQNENSEWAKKTLVELEASSPTSLKATLRQLRLGRKLDFMGCFRMEYRMVQGFLQTPDFFEGVTSRLIDKRQAKWSPSLSQLSSITTDEIESRFFAPLPSVKFPHAINSSLPSQQLNFVKNLTFFEYPHRALSGLPTDRDVENVIAGRHRRGQQMMSLSKNQDVVNTFTSKWGGYDNTLIGSDAQRLPRNAVIDNGRGKGKKGLKEKVLSILERRSPPLV
ncbi:ClpP/crotonase [Rhizoclosmatium globosum]|uniref:3-hydroxyisobutyryl-CoA hydrolase n=1 Tax=Rhizoclosmatium globosum TaxID=329046 RepID=A0A1Y2C669_9FUNG|nr:ClpP/crotonase [Rhizoclosmatium globosum]|eukprot:ORY42531.1 ClpP/crotonase [Rhizoclosmatium globosum]